MERLSGADSAFWYLESESVHLHVGALISLAEYPGERLSYERFVVWLRDRIELVEHLRYKISEPPFALGFPIWRLEDDFDLERHLHYHDLSLSHDDALVRTLDQVLCDPLDRSHSPWEMHFLDLALDDGVAIIVKVHHALLDGTLGMELISRLMDIEPFPRVTPRFERPASSPPRPALFSMLSDVTSDLSQRLVGISKMKSLIEEVAAGLRLDDSADVVAVLNPSAPRCIISGALSPRRSVSSLTLSLHRVRGCARAARVPIGDLVLAMVAGAIRSYLSSQGELPEKELVALVPMSGRGKMSGRNQMGGQLIEIPILDAEPLARLEAAALAAKSAKELHKVAGPALAEAFTTVMAGPFLAPFAQILEKSKAFDVLSPIFNLVISNLAGPSTELFLDGCLVKSITPFGPLAQGSGLNITVLSYGEDLSIGIEVCPDLIPDPAILAARINDELGVLEAALDL